MKIRIAFFDIDGTLLPFGEPTLREAVAKSLVRLQAAGVKLFIATGRPPFFLPEFSGVSFDGVLSFNGGYCYNKEGVIYSNPIAEADVRQVVANAEAIGLPVALATMDRHGCNGMEQHLEAYLQISGHSCQLVEDFQAFQREKVYQMMIGSSPAQDAVLLAGTKQSKVARWWDGAMDIIPANSGKAPGIAMILRHYGLDREECIAFGDGGNDMDMIEYAGIGVAMGNASEEVKAVADYVTASCEEDGVAQAIEELLSGRLQ